MKNKTLEHRFRIFWLFIQAAFIVLSHVTMTKAEGKAPETTRRMKLLEYVLNDTTIPIYKIASVASFPNAIGNDGGFCTNVIGEYQNNLQEDAAPHSNVMAVAINLVHDSKSRIAKKIARNLELIWRQGVSLTRSHRLLAAAADPDRARIATTGKAFLAIMGGIISIESQKTIMDGPGGSVVEIITEEDSNKIRKIIDNTQANLDSIRAESEQIREISLIRATADGRALGARVCLGAELDNLWTNLLYPEIEKVVGREDVPLGKVSSEGGNMKGNSRSSDQLYPEKTIRFVPSKELRDVCVRVTWHRNEAIVDRTYHFFSALSKNEDVILPPHTGVLSRYSKVAMIVPNNADSADVTILTSSERFEATVDGMSVSDEPKSGKIKVGGNPQFEMKTRLPNDSRPQVLLGHEDISSCRQTGRELLRLLEDKSKEHTIHYPLKVKSVLISILNDTKWNTVIPVRSLGIEKEKIPFTIEISKIVDNDMTCEVKATRTDGKRKKTSKMKGVFVYDLVRGCRLALIEGAAKRATSVDQTEIDVNAPDVTGHVIYYGPSIILSESASKVEYEDLRYHSRNDEPERTSAELLPVVTP